MDAPEAKSEAFRQATTRSERIRILGLLAALAALLLLAVVRTLVARSEAHLQLLLWVAALLLSAGAYESVMLAILTRALHAKRDLPRWVWTLNLFIETLLPTAALLLLTESTFMGPYRALLAPAALCYFVFIILSTLRLSPALCWLTGAFSVIGYLAMVAYTYWQYPDARPGGSLFSMPVYITYAALILIGGLIAGAVAGQIRTHVRAALREAEARRKVAQMEHDLSIARSIQQGLLPRQPPQIDGFEIAGWSRPADETGGDYYDWQSLPDGRTAISLADVTGHGIGPALVTAVCRAYSRASFPTGDDLAALIDRMNELLVEDLPPDRFVTFVAGLLDPSKSSIHLLSAGHGPILVYRAAAHRVEEFDAHDLPFGVTSGVGYGPSQELPLAPGDILVLITDGFFEWANAYGEQFGTTRLGETIQAASALPAQEMISRLYSAVVEFSGGTAQEDDLTVVVIKRTDDNAAGAASEAGREEGILHPSERGRAAPDTTVDQS